MGESSRHRDSQRKKTHFLNRMGNLGMVEASDGGD